MAPRLTTMVLLLLVPIKTGNVTRTHGCVASLTNVGSTNMWPFLPAPGKPVLSRHQINLTPWNIRGGRYTIFLSCCPYWSPFTDDGSGSVTILEAYRGLIAADFHPVRPVEFHWYSAEVFCFACFNASRILTRYRKEVFSVPKRSQRTISRVLWMLLQWARYGRMSFSIGQTSLTGFQFDMTAWVKVNLYWILRRLQTLLYSPARDAGGSRDNYWLHWSKVIPHDFACSLAWTLYSLTKFNMEIVDTYLDIPYVPVSLDAPMKELWHS